MCDPVSYAVIRTGMAYQEYQSYKAEAKYINQNTVATAGRIRNEAIYKDISLQKKQGVEYDKTAADKFKIAIEAKQKRGTAKVQLFERGLGGNLFTSIIGEIDRQEGRAYESQDINYENVIMSLDEQRLAWNRQFGNQILSLPRVAPPSFRKYALCAAADISSVYMANTAPSTNPVTGTGRFDGAGTMESYQLNPTGYSGSR